MLAFIIFHVDFSVKKSEVLLGMSATENHGVLACKEPISATSLRYQELRKYFIDGQWPFPTCSL